MDALLLTHEFFHDRFRVGRLRIGANCLVGARSTVYCIQAAINEQRSFIRWSQKTRPWTIVFLGVFVALGLENPSILIFGVIDLLATLWTALALRSPGAAASGMTCSQCVSREAEKTVAMTDRSP